MLHSQHQAMKRIIDDSKSEMELTRKSLDQLAKFIPILNKKIEKLADDKKETHARIEEINKFMKKYVFESEKTSKLKLTPAEPKPETASDAEPIVADADSLADNKEPVKSKKAKPTQSPALSEEEVKEMLELKSKMKKTGKIK
jgi:methyl-accepting chemotaxis protein